MQRVYTLRKISLILCVIFLFLGCNPKAEVDFSVTANGTSEGIRLYFHNIPEDTYSIFISFWDITAYGQTDDKFSGTNVYIFDNDLSKNELSKIKTSGNLICPFVENGHKYSINVTVYTINDYENNFEGIKNPLTYSTSVIASGGIYLTNNPTLNFTDENSTVTLSEMPTFSKEVVYSQNGLLQFTNFVLIDGNSYGGGMSYWNELIYPARQIPSSTQEHFGFEGNFPVNASVYSILFDGDFEWSVIIAKAEENAIMSF